MPALHGAAWPSVVVQALMSYAGVLPLLVALALAPLAGLSIHALAA